MHAPSPYWGAERIWDSQTTVTIRCSTTRGGSGSPPEFVRRRIRRSARRARTIRRRSCSRSNRPGGSSRMYDPKTGKFTLIDTCFSTHHLMFAEDANHTLWLSSGGAGSGVVGWLNTKMFDETGDEQKSQGWTAFILDTNGNGKRDEYVEPEPSRSIRRRTSGSSPASTASPSARSTGRSGASVLRFPGRNRAHHSRRQPAGDRARGNLRSAVERPKPP